MPSLNEHTIIGHVGQDPEIKHKPDGGAIALLSVATSESWKDKDSGEKKERTEWHRVVVFGKGAEFIANYVHKGDLVMARAPGRTRKWQDKEGNERYTYEITCNRYEHFTLLKSQSGTQKPAAQKPVQQEEKYDDDIPF